MASEMAYLSLISGLNGALGVLDTCVNGQNRNEKQAVTLLCFSCILNNILSLLFRQMADCGGLPQVDQVCIHYVYGHLDSFTSSRHRMIIRDEACHNLITDST